MILKSNNNKRVEIKIKNFDLPNGISDMDFLRVILRESTPGRNWEAEHSFFTPREALTLSKWMRKLAGKDHRYSSSLEFHSAGLSFKGSVLKGGIKKIVMKLSGEYKPRFIKTRRPYFIPLELTDKELKQAAFDLKNEIPPSKKMSLPEIIKMEADAIKDLVLVNAPDTMRYAEGRKIKTLAPENGITDEVSIIIKHTGDHSTCNEGNDLFWTPFIAGTLKVKGDKRNLLTSEFYEQALKKNFCPLLTNRLTEFFKKAFFETDARYKNGSDEFKPGRIDESFIRFYEDDFYKEDADKIVGSVYINFSFNEIKYNPLCISINAAPPEEFMKLFSNNFKMALHFFKSFVPDVFFKTIGHPKIKCDYKNIKLLYKYKLPETFKKLNHDKRK